MSLRLRDSSWAELVVASKLSDIWMVLIHTSCSVLRNVTTIVLSA